MQKAQHYQHKYVHACDVSVFFPSNVGFFLMEKNS